MKNASTDTEPTTITNAIAPEQEAQPERKKDPAIISYALIMVTALFWGLSFIAMNVVLDRLEPLQLIAGRWTLAAIIFTVLILFGKLKINLHKKNVKYLILCGITEPGLYAIFETYGLKFTSPSTSSIFIATIPCMALIIGALFFHQKTNRLGLLSIILAFFGVVICTVFTPGFSLHGDLRGYFLMMCAVVAGGVFGFFSERAGQDYSAIEITAMMAYIGMIAFNIECLVMGYGASTYTIVFNNWDILLAEIFLGVCCSIICYVAFNRIMSNMDIALANNMSSSLITVVGVSAGIFINGDPCGLYTLIGLGITLIGVCLSSRA